MRIQDDDYTCGPCAIVNALEAVGRRISEDEAEELAGTTGDGTDEKDIAGALSRLGYDAERLPHASNDELYAGVQGALREGDSVLLYSNSRQHWMAAIGTIGDRVVVFDSDNTDDNEARSGVRVVDAAGLASMVKPERFALRVVPRVRSLVAEAMSGLEIA